MTGLATKLNRIANEVVDLGRGGSLGRMPRAAAGVGCRAGFCPYTG